MADLSSLLRRSNKGSAAESTLTYFGEELRRLKDRAENEIEAAWQAKDDVGLYRAVADWLTLRRLFKRFDQDVKDGQVAAKEIERG